MTVEIGNATQRRSELCDNGLLNGSLYFGYKTPLAPAYLGVGFSEDRYPINFLRFGSIFGPRSLGRR